MAEPWTIARLLKWSSSFLSEKGSESPRLDAELLLRLDAAAGGCWTLHGAVVVLA